MFTDSDKFHSQGLERMQEALLFLLCIVFFGIAGFMLLENMSFIDALYLTVITIATVGYGDVVTHSTLGKIFTVLLVVSGVGMAAYTFSMGISMAVEGQLSYIWGRREMQRKIKRLDNHIIVCGSGRVGLNVIERLQQEKEAFVVIERDVQAADKLILQDVSVVVGDATFDKVMIEAGVKRARGIISALPTDSENVYVTLTAKTLNPDIVIVARAAHKEAEDKLLHAGAETVIFPSVMAARQMVTAMTKPVIRDMLENIFYNDELHLDVAQITVSSASQMVGRTLLENRIRDDFGSFIIAIKRGEAMINNPRANEVVAAGDILIAIGERHLLTDLNGFANIERKGSK